MVKTGALIAIDGVDSSGKETQTRMLCERLEADGIKVKRVSFPDYSSNSSALVKMYLAGEFGSSAQDVNAYAASAFFAVDRYASYKKTWGAELQAGTVIIADRYVSSNMIHQAGKLSDSGARAEFLSWLDDFEFEKLGLPRPDATIFLDMPVEYARSLMAKRANKITGEEAKDIHERDEAYLTQSYNNAVDVAKAMGWNRISCTAEGSVRTVEDINNEIYALVSGILHP